MGPKLHSSEEAAAAYVLMQVLVRRQLADLVRLAKRHQQGVTPEDVTWDHVGDLAVVNEVLANAREFLDASEH